MDFKGDAIDKDLKFQQYPVSNHFYLLLLTKVRPELLLLIQQ